jgi:hypothetical protein
MSVERCVKCKSIRVERGIAASPEMREVDIRYKPIDLPESQSMRCVECGHEWQHPLGQAREPSR